MNIKLVRLVTGEDVLTEFVDTGDVVTFINPLIVYIRPTETGVPQVGMSQWVPYSAAKEFNIPKERIVFVTEPAEDIRGNYDRVFGSGLIVPSSTIATS